ncbi:MAG: hypothetical protein R3214_03945, partial [Christiangramia sp.]|nr:hypothetical protein [Christiangramia sp.]
TYLQKKIVGGYADLFYLRDHENKLRFYVSHEDHGDQELTIKTSKTDIGGKTYNRESKQYLGTLALLFNDCPQENLASTKYTIKSLSRIFIDYNNCKNNLSYTAEEIHKKPEVRVAFMGGANFTTITTGYETLTGDFGYQSGMDIGMELSIIPAFADSHFSFVLGVNYSDKGGEAEYLRQRFERAVIDYQMIAIDLSVRYNFLPPSAKLNPYIGIFANKSFFLKSQEERMRKIADDGNSDYLIDIGIHFPNSFPLSFSAEAGLNYLLNDNSGLTLNANLYKYDDGEGFFEAKGYAVQAGYFISL